ncbi:hypothetical protein MMYC01_202616 [Madurella mycetomatis]|uniref:Nucleoporin Nup159/Nup146 N-terminal domain-containing protein n=1 Tax=Madurella mycetomatis TaxID=100816 RepID=A0A175WB85_9PEZI|nr:hypothetical protein MMYC01_202616 [Madurella mycetomatis]
MAFGFGSVSNAMMGTTGGGVGGMTQGGDLEVIQTEGLGFLSIAGEAKVQLTAKWSPGPAPTASLMSIASRKGLVAAAGPDAVHIASTESVRKAFQSEKNGDSEVRPFNPEAKVPLPFRISQLAFTADEQYLVLSAETGGGLAVYEVQTLVQGGTQSAFELSTNGETLRALVPNPMPESGGLCAIVTNNGNLFMANLAERKLVQGSNGPVLRSQVSCAAWSTKGKQLVAGMADGSIYQMTPDGVEKGHIPKPPNLGDYHVASVTWLENHVFLTVHNPTNGQEPSIYHIITRQQPAGGTPTFTFQKLTDPVEPFVSDKVPHHTVLRLKDFPPNLQDLLLVSSTATESVGLLSRSKTPLASDKPAEAITNVFTTTELADDSKRAQLPMSEDLTDTYPVGTALDLSSKDKVYKPIPTDEIELSPGPLPGLWVLNNEGVLSSWWIVYNESIRSGTTYPGIAAGDAVATAFSAQLPATSGSTAFGSPANKAPSFGSPSAATPAFGGTSILGAKPSPWSTAAGGTSLFGARQAAPAFGQSSTIGLGNKVSPWASGSANATPAFGQSGFSGSGSGPGKVFGSGAGGAPASGGFASFAGKGGFGSLGGSAGGSSIFGSKTGSAFASKAPEVSMDTDTAFPPPSAKNDKPALGSSPFVLGTTFKADPSAVSADEKPKEGAGKSLFEGGFGLSLDDAAKQPAVPESKEEEMKSTTPPPEEKPKSVFARESTTPTTTPAPQRFDMKTAPPAGGSSLFGARTAPSAGFSNLFGTPKPSAELPRPKSVSSIFDTPKIKQEDEDKENLSKIPEAPLPPDPTISKAPVKPEDALLPPVFPGKPSPSKADEAKSFDKTPQLAASPSKPEAKQTRLVGKEALPPQDTLPAVPDSAEEEGFSEEAEESEEAGEGEESSEAASEGSGIDVAKDLSPTAGLGTHTPGVTPHSSFGGMAGSTFSTISRSEAEQPRQLFGEIRQPPAWFPKTVPQSPRSPSPMRGGPQRSSILRPSEPPRSFSAPGTASQLLGRKPLPTPSALGLAASQRALPSIDPNVQAQRKQAAKVEAEQHVLVDPEDEGIQQILQSEVEPSLRMHEFLAVDSKLEALERSGREEVPAACETLWRDINRMIDRLGLNSRSLQSFILGHTTQFAEGGRRLEDLEHPDDWVLVEAEDLGMLVDGELTNGLEKGRIQDVSGTNAAIQSLAKDLAKLRAKEEDMRKVINLHIDPEQISVVKSLPLSAEQTAQQNELRRSYTNFLNLLADAESALTMLKAKMASAGGASGKASVPTVEAVMRTISKMTGMVEKRSGDIDVLENQMRRLRLGSVGPNGTPAHEREGSPFPMSPNTPQKGASNRRSLLMTPEQQHRKRDSISMSLAASVMGARGTSTPGTPVTPQRKKMSMYTEDEKRAVRAKDAKRKATLQMLRASLQRAGPNVARLRDDD